MGNLLSFFWWFGGTQPRRVVILGLDNAGKTTLLFKLKLGEVVSTIPTVGFNVESVKFNNVTIMMWDVGGQEKIRTLWKHYFENTEGIVWVIDSADTSRIAEAKEELHRVLAEEQLLKAPVLIFANKQDLPNALKVAELHEQLEISKLETTRPVFIQPATATQGQGINQGLEWLVQALLKKK